MIIILVETLQNNGENSINRKICSQTIEGYHPKTSNENNSEIGEYTK